MENEFEQLSNEESLKAENDFLKMKLMLEHGAHFGNMESKGTLPPDLENQFLINIMAFEKKFAEPRKLVKIFDKIGCPKHFKPEAEIPDTDIAEAWTRLDGHLGKHGICLSAISPRVTDRELYRFTTTELFDYELDDIDLPGWTTQFTYDEFYPDEEFENTNAAVEDCMEIILSVKPLAFMPHFRNTAIMLNGQLCKDENEFKHRVNLFKSAYDDIDAVKVTNTSCSFIDNTCTITGMYKLHAKYQNQSDTLEGSWTVKFEKDEKIGYWYIFYVWIDGIKL